jgi:hypothetical protein
MSRQNGVTQKHYGGNVARTTQQVEETKLTVAAKRNRKRGEKCGARKCSEEKKKEAQQLAARRL